MADYHYRSISERKEMQHLWESGLPVKDIAATLELSPSSVYAELRRGRDGTRLPDKRLKYDAELAQLHMQEALERRGRKAAGA